MKLNVACKHLAAEANRPQHQQRSLPKARHAHAVQAENKGGRCTRYTWLLMAPLRLLLTSNWWKKPHEYEDSREILHQPRPCQKPAL